MLHIFSGREDKTSFWPYAGAVLVVSILPMFIGMAPVLASMQQFAIENPEDATIRSGPGHYSIEIKNADFTPDFSPMFAGLGLAFAIAIVLYAAAVTRRLHDTGRRGWWGLLPLPFITATMIMMPRALGSPGQEPDLGPFFAVFISNLLYLVSLTVLIVLLAGKSKLSPVERPSTQH